MPLNLLYNQLCREIPRDVPGIACGIESNIMS